MFAFMVRRGNLIRSKKSERARFDMYLRQLRLSADCREVSKNRSQLAHCVVGRDAK
jgi:hypothetical protein